MTNPKTRPESFEQFMRDVDREIQAICGLSSRDLADYRYFDAYEDGVKAKSVAKKVLKTEGFYE